MDRGDGPIRAVRGWVKIRSGRISADISGFALGSQTKPKCLEYLEISGGNLWGYGCGAKRAPPGWAYFVTKIRASVNAQPSKDYLQA
jgi:hypothetical protein